ncbi:SH3 domain protein [Trichostrongylus colubriformis]|uniref:SH3 domain protein n=1 Tax=Trichostrongylus colubriformis TaxID=6319 RepID=A0AAN8IVS7_TRICO
MTEHAATSAVECDSVLPREMTPIKETTDSGMSSLESSPSDMAASRFARKKWSSAFRVVQGLHRFRLALHRKERHSNESSNPHSNESTPNRDTDAPVDPVYLALKQATGKYGGRRGSSANNLDFSTPSPGNSQASLQDSGYAEMSTVKGNPMLGSTPQLDNSGRSTGRRRAPKLSTQMKSLSLDCQEMPPRINAVTRSPMRSKMISGHLIGKNGSSDLSDWDRSCSPCYGNSRRGSAVANLTGGYVVIHEYAPTNGAAPLVLGERVHVVDNGDPDWLHGFREQDRTERLLSFPATCVALMLPGEQAMKILQNVAVPEMKLRLYRDQVVFAQPDSLHDGKVTIRTAHNAIAPCPLTSLALV